jgi:hypothetical protein
VRPYLEKPFTIGLVEWLKVRAPSSSPSTEKIKKKIYSRICLPIQEEASKLERKK